MKKPDNLSISEKKELLRIEADKKKFEYEKKIIKEKQKLEQQKARAKINAIEKQNRISNNVAEKERLTNLELEIDNKIKVLSSSVLPNESEELIKVLNEISFELNSTSWQPNSTIDSEENKQMKRLFKAYIAKYEKSINKLAYNKTHEFEVAEYRKDLKKLLRKGFIREYGLPLIVLSVILIMTILYLTGIMDKKNAQLPTSCIKHWGLSGYMNVSAPHQLLQRQTGTKPEIPNVLYMYRCAQLFEKEYATTISKNSTKSYRKQEPLFMEWHRNLLF